MKKQLILSLALMLTLFSFAQKKELKKLEKAVKSNNYAEAKTLVSQLESMVNAMDDKTKSKYYFNAAQAFYANGTGNAADIENVLSNFSKVNSKHISNLAAVKQTISNDFLTKANNKYGSKNYTEASSLFSTLYKLNPKDQVYLYYAAVSAVAAKDYNTALQHYTKLKDLDYTGVETQYFATNKETGEEEVLSKQTRDTYVKIKTHINPGERQTESKKAEITKNIALIYLDQGKNDEALAAIKDARIENPDNTDLIINEANVQYKLGNKDAYSKLIKEAIAKDPNNQDLLFNLGVVESEAGNVTEAKNYYKKVLDLNPNHVNTLTNMAALILADESKIIEQMNSLGTSAADDKKYDELKLVKKELYNSAVPYLEKIIALDSKNIDVAKTLYNIYNVIDQTAKANDLKAKFGL